LPFAIVLWHFIQHHYWVEISNLGSAKGSANGFDVGSPDAILFIATFFGQNFSLTSNNPFLF
jgi:hypothetical protein